MTEKKRALLQIDPRAVGHAPIDTTFPHYWFQWGDQVIIDPVPEKIYNLLLYIPDWPSAELLLDADEPDDIPPEFHRSIVDYACFALSLKLKKWQQAALYYDIYIQNLNLRKREYIERKAEQLIEHNIPEKVNFRGEPRWGL